MAYDDGMAQMLRDDLADEVLREVRMFGGICFMLTGNMICGVHKDGALFRVGPEGYATALKIKGITPMTMTGRAMKGIVDCPPEVFADDAARLQLLGLSLEFVKSLSPK